MSGTGGYPGDGDGDGDHSDPEEPPEEETGDTESEPACDDATPTILYLSPDASNSMSSPVQAREAVLAGWGSLAGLPVRTWEFMNYYDFGYPEAPAGELEIHAALRPVAGAEEGEADFVMQIGVASETVTHAQRAPMNITFVLDTSGSMQGHSMDMLKASCLAVAGELREGDVVSMVTWDTSNSVILGGYQVSGPNDANLLQRIHDIEAGGGTDLHGGLVSGYELAMSAYDTNRINRVLLISDGGANVGITDEEVIAAHAGGNDEDGIYMVGVGVGSTGSYNDALMDRVTDVGKGASVFINASSEAEKIFGEDFVNTFSVAARDVQVELDLPPGFQIERFSGEEYSEDPTEIEPQHLAPNDAMVFYQSLSTCAPELVEDETLVTITARYRDAITFEDREVVRELSFMELMEGASAPMAKGRAVFDYAEALHAKQGTSQGEPVTVEEALASLAEAEALLPGDAELGEIRKVLEAL
jgi:Ca-activated chloride channel family protein